MPCSARAHLQSQQSCRKSLGFACGRIGGVRQCTSKASPGLLGGLGAAAPDSTRPSQTTIGPAHSSARGPAPLLLQVVLERELRLPGLQTRKGAKHAPHGQQRARISGRESRRAGFEWRCTCGHQSSGKAPTHWSAPTCGGGWWPFWTGGHSSTAELPASKSQAALLSQLKKQLAKQLRQLFLRRAHRQQQLEAASLFRK